MLVLCDDTPPNHELFLSDVWDSKSKGKCMRAMSKVRDIADPEDVEPEFEGSSNIAQNQTRSQENYQEQAITYNAPRASIVTIGNQHFLFFHTAHTGNDMSMPENDDNATAKNNKNDLDKIGSTSGKPQVTKGKNQTKTAPQNNNSKKTASAINTNTRVQNLNKTKGPYKPVNKTPVTNSKTKNINVRPNITKPIKGTKN